MHKKYINQTKKYDKEISIKSTSGKALKPNNKYIS